MSNTDWKKQRAKETARTKEVLKFLNKEEKEIIENLRSEWSHFENTICEVQDIWLGDVRKLSSIIYKISNKFTK
jgi:hypothetical protein